MEDMDDIVRDITRQNSEVDHQTNKRNRTEEDISQGRSKTFKSKSNQTTIEEGTDQDQDASGEESDEETQNKKILNSTPIFPVLHGWKPTQSKTLDQHNIKPKEIEHYVSVKETPFNKNKPAGRNQHNTIPETPEQMSKYKTIFEDPTTRKDEPIPQQHKKRNESHDDDAIIKDLCYQEIESKGRVKKKV